MYSPRSVPNTSVDGWVDLIWHVMDQPQTPPDELLLEDRHLCLFHLLLPHHLPSLYHVLKVQVPKTFLMGVLALGPGVDGIMMRVWLEGVYKRISV